MDNQTKIAIKNSELTHETIQNLSQGQAQPGVGGAASPAALPASIQ
jgi:hypothetical protein